MAKQNSQGKSLKQQAYEKLTTMFLKGELKQGDPLIELNLSEKMKISRTPLREAFLQMEKEGIVEIIPRKGAFIKRITLHDIQEVFQIREAIEGMAAHLAATKITENQIEALEKIFNQADECRGDDSFLKAAEKAGDNLHEMVLQISGNLRIREILNSYQLLLMREQKKAASIPVIIEQAFDDHKEILTGLKESPDAAEKAMRTHIRKTLNAVINQTN